MKLFGKFVFVFALVLMFFSGVVVAVDPNDLHAAYMRGVQAVGQGDLKTAEESFKLITKNAPMLVEGFLNLAVVYEQGHQWSKAMSVYRKAMLEHPSNGKVPMNMCVTLLRLIQEGLSHIIPEDSPRVREVCHLAKRLNQDDPTVHSNLGDMHTLLVDWAEAATAYRDAIALYDTAEKTGTLKSKSWKDSFMPQRTWSNLANSYSRAGQVEAAVEAAQRALSLAEHDAHNLALLGTIRTTGRKFDFQTRAIKRRAALLQAAALSLRDVSCPRGISPYQRKA